jgi:hypothetical protein
MTRFVHVVGGAVLLDVGGVVVSSPVVVEAVVDKTTVLDEVIELLNEVLITDEELVLLVEEVEVFVG